MSHRHLPHLLCGLLVLFLASSIGAVKGEVTESLSLGFLEGAHTGSATDLGPIEQGPITVKVAVPEYRVNVHRHLFTFRRPPRAGAGALPGAPLEAPVEASVEVELDGAGRLVAVFAGAGSEQAMTDELTVPRQTLSLAGKVRLERAEGGYLVTIVEAPETVGVAIQSRALTQLVAGCEALAQLPLLPISCDGFGEMLSKARVPLPEPGESFLLEAARLTPAERAAFDRLTAP